jgi:hypothetical protein
LRKGNICKLKTVFNRGFLGIYILASLLPNKRRNLAEVKFPVRVSVQLIRATKTINYKGEKKNEKENQPQTGFEQENHSQPGVFRNETGQRRRLH